MASGVEKLVRMANQIATAFQHYPPETAVPAIRDHIQAFWSPEMRVALRDWAAGAPAGEDQGTLNPLVREALTLLPPVRQMAETAPRGQDFT